jgi:hypothetical protein
VNGLVSGGLRLWGGSETFVTSMPRWLIPPGAQIRQWFVAISSNLGGAARKDFVVFAYCFAGG